MNANHPEKDSIITVDPIRELTDIARIKKNLSGHPRNLALFVTGINSNLRGSDLLSITVGMVIGLKVGESFQIREQKTGKVRQIPLSKAVHATINALLVTLKEPQDTDLLFQSRKGSSKGKRKGESVERSNHSMTIQSLNRLVNEWCHGIKGNFGAHTLRKTFGYVQRVHFGVGLPELMKAFNHSSQAQTLKYIGVSDETIHDIFMNEI